MVDAMSAYAKRVNELVAKYTREALATLAQRSGKARASVIYAAWERQESNLQPENAMPSEDLIRLRNEVVASVNDLTRNQQQQLLAFFWPRLPNNLLLDFVRDTSTGRIAADPFFREQAFKRWCELASSDCEAALVGEILKSATDLQPTTLFLLPIKDHPEFDTIFAARLKSNPFGVSPLIARYGSPGIAPIVRQTLLESAQANYCPVKENLLVYLLRVAPEEGSTAIAKVLEQRSKDNCRAGMLESMARVYYTPELSKLAEKVIRADPDPSVAASAATVLSEFGPRSAEQALWDRFANWSEHWRDKAAELRDINQPDRRLEFALANAIANSKAWRISPADFGALESLCVTTSCWNIVENWRSSSKE